MRVSSEQLKDNRSIYSLSCFQIHQLSTLIAINQVIPLNIVKS